MLSVTEFPTPGQIINKLDQLVVFKPAGTSYELHLQTASPYEGPIQEPIDVVIRVTARKVYTVPSGGNFIQPIFGPPRIVQGRVKYADESQLVVHASANFVVELPASDSAIDLNSGRIAVGSMVNVVALPGAMLEVIGS